MESFRGRQLRMYDIVLLCMGFYSRLDFLSPLDNPGNDEGGETIHVIYRTYFSCVSSLNTINLLAGSVYIVAVHAQHHRAVTQL